MDLFTFRSRRGGNAACMMACGAHFCIKKQSSPPKTSGPRFLHTKKTRSFLDFPIFFLSLSCQPMCKKGIKSDGISSIIPANWHKKWSICHTRFCASESPSVLFRGEQIGKQNTAAFSDTPRPCTLLGTLLLSSAGKSHLSRRPSSVSIRRLTRQNIGTRSRVYGEKKQPPRYSERYGLRVTFSSKIAVSCPTLHLQAITLHLFLKIITYSNKSTFI